VCTTALTTAATTIANENRQLMGALMFTCSGRYVVTTHTLVIIPLLLLYVTAQAVCMTRIIVTLRFVY
jgi:hypothetical protein